MSRFITGQAAAMHLAEAMGIDIKNVHKITITLEVGEAAKMDIEYFVTSTDMAYVEHELITLKRVEE